MLLGVLASLLFGLYFLEAIGASAAPQWADVVVTGLLVSGGTKALHDLMSRIETAKAAAAAKLAR